MNRLVYAIRGAAAIDNPDDEAGEMVEAVGKLLDIILDKNSLTPDDIVSIQFTQTADLTVKNAAAALREARPAYGLIPLFCSQEPSIEGMLPRVVRVLVTCRGEGPGIPVYLGSAKMLRPDVAG